MPVGIYKYCKPIKLLFKLHKIYKIQYVVQFHKNIYLSYLKLDLLTTFINQNNKIWVYTMVNNVQCIGNKNIQVRSTIYVDFFLECINLSLYEHYSIINTIGSVNEDVIIPSHLFVNKKYELELSFNLRGIHTNSFSIFTFNETYLQSRNINLSVAQFKNNLKF